MSAEAAPSVKVLVIGASGTIGALVVSELEKREGVTVFKAGRSGEHKVDVNDQESIKALFESIGKLDHIVFAAGGGDFAPVATMSHESLAKSINNKFMCQADVTLIGQNYLNDGGSITLTSGLLDKEPVPMAAGLSAANAALHGWTTAVAAELKRGCRINCVSPGLLTESAGAYGAFFPGFDTVDGIKVARAYIRSMFSGLTGRTLERFT